MVALNSKNDICNLSQVLIGSRQTIMNIDIPRNDAESTYALTYDIVRQTTIKQVMPNWAMRRVNLAEVVLPAAVPFGYTHAYEYPSYCLKILGIGNIDEKLEQRVSVEGRYIYTDTEYKDGLPLRYLHDETDVSRMSSDFKQLLAAEVASVVCLVITQSTEKKAYLDKMLPIMRQSFSGLAAQENPPVRRSVSRFRQARYYNLPSNTDKK